MQGKNKCIISEAIGDEYNGPFRTLIMNVPKDRLGCQEKGGLDLVNLKCGPAMAASLAGEDQKKELVRRLK